MEKINLLKTLYDEVYIPEEVYKEVVTRGLEGGHSDAIIIEDCINQQWLKIKTLDDNQTQRSYTILKHTQELHLGEIQAIIYAQKYSYLLLMDESCGRAFAQSWGVDVKGTVYVVLKSLRRGYLKTEEAKESLLAMVENGFRIEPKLLARMLREIDHTAN